ncbi:hypothetical protein [Chryseobacterium vrystaatense]|nr:hypothetical protein [Chryseobacterium vrystaatense]
MNLIVKYVDEDYQRLLNNKYITAVNFPIKDAVKIFGSYDKLRGKKKLKTEIQNIIGFEDDHLDSCEGIENFLVFTYHLLKTNKNLVVSTVGLSYESINHYIKIMELILTKLSDRTLYVIKNFSAIDELVLTDLYIHINTVEKETVFDFMKNWLIGFKTKDEYFIYPEYFGKVEFETGDYFEMLSFILSGPNRDYGFHFHNRNNPQNPKAMILIRNNSLYLGIGVTPNYEKHFIERLLKEYHKTPIVCHGVLPY